MIQSNKSLFTNRKAVGRTDASDASYDNSILLTRNADKLVSLVLERSCSSVQGITLSTKQLVRSLIIPIVARRSKRAVWFTDKELGKFVRSMTKTVIVLHTIADEMSREQAFIKYWTGFYMCKIFQDPVLPAREDWINCHLFYGWVKLFVGRRLAKRDISFFFSFDKGAKQSWPAMSTEKRDAVLQKHKERLSRPQRAVSQQFLNVLDVCIDEIFSDPPPPTKFLPSGSACLQATVSNGGALSLYGSPVALDEENRLGTLRALTHSLVRWRKETYRFARRMATDLLETLVGESDTGPYPAALEVKIVALAEPGKYRIISKGDGYLYTALQPLQGQLLSCWKQSKYSTMRFSDLTERVDAINLPELPLWCSVDYEAATDNILKHPSMHILDRICEFGKFEDVILGAMSFMYCRAVYPDGSSIDAFEAQLMGHPLSFPILCVINMAAYRTAIKRWVAADRDRARLGRMMWRNFICNGDDLLFKCTADFVPFFYEAARETGLMPSIGKNFLSPDLCTINSQIFRCENGRIIRYSYLNQRFIYGKGNFRKASSDHDATTPTMVAKGINEMIHFVPWSACVLPMCLKRFGDHRFGSAFRTANWFLPVHLGGYGFSLEHAPPTLRITQEQRLLAAMFYHNPSLALYRTKNVTISTAKFINSVANYRMVPGSYVQQEDEQEDLEDLWLARLMYFGRLSFKPDHLKEGVYLSKFKKDWRLSPMSIRRMIELWEVRFFATKLPVCPPLNILH